MLHREGSQIADRDKFQWTPEFWQSWRESSSPYRQYKSERDRRLVLKTLGLRDGDRVLEVGCGYGWISEVLWGSANIEWTGVDREGAMLQRLSAAHPEHRNRILVSDAGHLPFGDAEFDKVLCTGVLMHIAENATAVRELLRVLRPAGRLLCSVNNALSPFSLPVRAWNYRKPGFVQVFQIPGSFRRRLRREGLRLEGTMGDGILATVPLAVGPFRFPPASISSALCKWDGWVTDRFTGLAYEVWFYGVKATPSCVS